MKRKASKRPEVKLLDAAMIELADGIRESLDAFRERVEIGGEYEEEEELLTDRDRAFQLGAAMQGHPERFQAVAAYAGPDLSDWLAELLSELAHCADYHEDAITVLDAFQAAMGDEHFLIYRPVLLAMAGRREEACAAVEAALAKQPTDVALQIGAADTYLESGRHADSERLVLGLLASTSDKHVCHGCLKERLHHIYTTTHRELEAKSLEQELIAADAAGTLHL